MDTPSNKLTVRMNWRVFTHPHVLCRAQNESCRRGARLVSLSVCRPVGIQIMTHFKRQNCSIGFSPLPLLAIRLSVWEACWQSILSFSLVCQEKQLPVVFL